MMEVDMSDYGKHKGMLIVRLRKLKKEKGYISTRLINKIRKMEWDEIVEELKKNKIKVKESLK